MKKLVFLAAITISQTLLAQNVGINNLTPLYPLSFNGSLGDKISLWTDGSSTHYGFGIQGGFFQMFTKNPSDRIVFGSGSSTAFIEKMRIDGNGNVGIGVTTPTAKLSISANGAELAGTAASNTLRTNAGVLGTTFDSEISLANFGFLSASNSSLGIKAYRSSTGSDWTSTTLLLGYDVDNTVRAGGALLALSANGNIGIGTVTPLQKLHVQGTTFLSGNVGIGASIPFSPLTFNNVVGEKISFYGSATNNYGLGLQDFTLQIHTDAVGSDIAFGYGSSGSFTERMRIKGNGNVGIGKNPTYTLDVTSNTSDRVGNFVNTATSVNNSGLIGSCDNTPGYGYGLIGSGGLAGVNGIAALPGTGDRYGIAGDASNGTFNYGVYGSANGGTLAYGIIAGASDAVTNWAGFFMGNVYTTGTYSSSDRKLKNEISPLSGALSIINQLNPSFYTFKTTEYKQMQLPQGIHYGLIADEVLRVLPGIVKKTIQPAQYENHNAHIGKKLNDEVEFDAVNYTEMIPILIGGVKEQQVIIYNLQKQIDELKKMVEKLLR